MSNLAIVAVIAFFALMGGGVMFFVFSECGLGALAYRDPLIAALTGQCK